MVNGGWTSLEVVKLVVGVLTPLLIAYFGYRLTRSTKTVQDAQWATRKLVDRRLDLYDKIAPDLNGLMCFFAMVGDFRSIDPPTAFRLKRELDATFHVNRFLISERFGKRYLDFVDGCFLHHVGSGRDALLRANAAVQRLERGPSNWSEDWTDYFVPDPADVTSPSEVRRQYLVLMETFADEVGAGGRSTA